MARWSNRGLHVATHPSGAAVMTTTTTRDDLTSRLSTSTCRKCHQCSPTRDHEPQGKRAMPCLPPLSCHGRERDTSRVPCSFVARHASPSGRLAACCCYLPMVCANQAGSTTHSAASRSKTTPARMRTHHLTAMNFSSATCPLRVAVTMLLVVPIANSISAKHDLNSLRTVRSETLSP
jgi:hypothetical protein